MSLLHALLRASDRMVPARIAYAHCDIPCGIYDPHHAQMAAHTVIRMNMLIKELQKPSAGDSREKHEEYHHKLDRYALVKEQHAELAKHEVRILWGDYFKPEHAQKYPELHDLVWRALKAGSKARQEINLQAAEDLLKTTNEIARIFWDTRGLPTLKVKAPYPTDRELVVPKLG